MTTSYTLSTAGLARFCQLRHQAIDAVTARFHATYPTEYAHFGERGRAACRDDIGFHLDFLQPVLEFGLLQPYTDYLDWFAGILASRNIPADHVPQSLQWLGEFFLDNMPDGEGQTIANTLSTAIALWQQPDRQNTSGDRFPDDKCEGEHEFEVALLNGDRQRAIDIVNRLLNSGHSLIDIEVNLIQRTLCHIGLRWQNNEVSIVQEHLATATAQTVMASVFAQSRLPPLNGKKLILACVEGNQHCVGLRMVSDAFELTGWHVQFLGANTPSRALVDQIRTWQPDLVGLSIAFPNQLSVARDTITQIRAAMGDHRPSVIVGGAAINRFLPLVQYVGADGHANDALAALQLANQPIMAYPRSA